MVASAVMVLKLHQPLPPSIIGANPAQYIFRSAGITEALVVEEGAATATVKVPVAADVVVTLIEGGFGQVTPGGKPAEGQVMATMPVKPPLGVTLTVDVPLPPAVAVAAVGVGVNANEPGDVMVNATALELLAVKLGSPLYCATME